jgi:hypothetical protein
MMNTISSFFLGGARFARTKRGNVVRFSGKARKTNHLSTFCERSEQKASKTGLTKIATFFLQIGLSY